MKSTRVNPSPINSSEIYPYLRAELIDYNYFPFITIGDNSLVANGVIMSFKPDSLGSLSDFGAEKAEYTIPPEIWRLIQCESSWNQEARGKAGEIGIAQFKKATWKLFNEMRGTNLDIYNADDQLEMTLWAYKNNLMFHWTCWKK